MKDIKLGSTPYSEKTFHVNDDEFVISQSQNVSPILDENKRLQNEFLNSKANFRKAASIPVVVWEEWMKEFTKKYGWNYMKAPKKYREKFIKAKLNDPDNAFLRVWKGKL